MPTLMIDMNDGGGAKRSSERNADLNTDRNTGDKESSDGATADGGSAEGSQGLGQASTPSSRPRSPSCFNRERETNSFSGSNESKGGAPAPSQSPDWPYTSFGGEQKESSYALGGQLSAHLFFFGGSFVQGVVGRLGKTPHAFFSQACVRMGIGAYLGMGANVGFSSGAASSGLSVGLGADVALGPSGGISVPKLAFDGGQVAASAEKDYAASVSLDPGIGIGISTGVDFCYTWIY